jgi:hypothetical protein
MNEMLTFNGLDAETGQYLVPRMPPGTLTDIILGEKWNQAHWRDLQARYDDQHMRGYGAQAGVEVEDLTQAGWGVIFPADVAPARVAEIREALSELLDWRKAQVNQVKELYKEFSGGNGYRRTDTKDTWLTRNGSGPGPAVVEKVPYYLLIVGDPQTIPYDFQYQLDVVYAVGRIHFDTLDEYAQYARSVVTAEREDAAKRARKARFVAVSNPGDSATALSAQHLIGPLVQSLDAAYRPKGWDIRVMQGDDAKKAAILDMLARDAPSVLFTASHGIGFKKDENEQAQYEHQLKHQGALVCQDWPGPAAGRVPIQRAHYLSGEDITNDVNLLGTVVFHFACFGAGTPYRDEFYELARKEPTPIARHAFIAGLPRRLLSLPRGGALAVIGHVERAWTFSFQWENIQEDTATFESALIHILDGKPVGTAVDYINSRYADIAVTLQHAKNNARYQEPNPLYLTKLWTANNDARGYAIIGDPAVRLRTAADGGGPAARPALEAIPPRNVVLGPVLDVESMPKGESLANVPQPPAPQAAPPSSGVMAPAASQFDAVAFGWFGEDAVDKIRKNLNKVTDDLVARLSDFIEKVTTLQVSTYVADDMKAVNFDDEEIQAVLRAVTRMTFDGDMKVVVPMEADILDEDLWDIHTRMVEQAQANRTAMFRAIAEVLASILPKG